MIKFFRRLRLRFISQKKVRKYLFYASGEIFLVMIGILLALQVSNWNQRRLNNSIEKQYLNRLVEDLEEDKAILMATLDYSSKVISYAKKAILVFEGSDKMNPDPVKNLEDMYQASQLQDPNSVETTYKELMSSGQINLIKSDHLKIALIRFYETDWDGTTVFLLPNKYRENLRSKMPDAIQTEIRDKCGDKYTKIRGGFEVVLPDTCQTNIEPKLAASIVQNLKNDESLKNDLRYLLGNENAKVMHMNAITNQLNTLIDLIKKETQQPN